MAIETGDSFRSVSAGFKWAVAGAFVLALLSLAGSGFLYRSLTSEILARQVLEDNQEQIRGKSINLEKNFQNYKTQTEEIQAKFKDYDITQIQFRKAIEDNDKAITELREKLKPAEENAPTPLPAVAESSDEGDSQPSSVPAGASPDAFIVPEETTPEPALAAVPPVAADEAAAMPPAAETVEPARPFHPVESAAAAPPPAAEPVAIPLPAVSSAPQPDAKQSKIMSVNRKFNFVVIGLGIKDGLQMGDTIEVFRQEKVIGTVQVEKLYENFVAATIVHEDKDIPIKEGDAIRKSS